MLAPRNGHAYIKVRTYHDHLNMEESKSLRVELVEHFLSPDSGHFGSNFFGSSQRVLFKYWSTMICEDFNELLHQLLVDMFVRFTELIVWRRIECQEDSKYVRIFEFRLKIE